ncbi:SET domain-containing protein [Chloropicon primus]|uniref:SET domain-containing protein n=1 Tax=Chloropicon primus TaxID=1764295 RepID=A0A5B8MN84_9CHLO|nr:hypothetical protein A3770_04p32780 [Chloropicon primus]UPQ99972.1 SET domain-containing protein [Chloropicon primus]|eukprot:QDZ20760.1 hypothetical protein A3770_04p32780 [Chloropicon primus]
MDEGSSRAQSVQEALSEASDSLLRVEVRAGRGRCLVAERPVRKGRVVLREMPYASVLNANKVGTHCDYTFKPGGGKLLRCSRTKVVKYLDREAQAGAWKAYFRDECRVASKMMEEKGEEFYSRLCMRSTLRLVCRMYWTRKARSPLQWTLVSQLHSNWETSSDAVKMTWAESAAHAHQILKLTEDSAPSVKELCAMFAAVSCNNLMVQDDYNEPVGFGIYPLASITNHSCTPNCVQAFSGKKLSLMCVRDIRAGEEITISYADLFSLHSERRATLLSGYGFDIDARTGGEAVGAVVSASPLVEAFRAEGDPPGSGGVPKSLVSDGEATFTEIRVAGGRHVGRGFTQIDEEVGGSEGGQKAVCSFASKDHARAAGLVLHQIQEGLTRSEQLLNQSKFREAREAVTKAVKQCEGSVVDGCDVQLSEHHILRLRGLHLLSHTALFLSDFETALNVGRELAEPFSRLYPNPWPNLGFHLSMLANLEADPSLGGTKEQAIARAREAAAILEATTPRSNVTRLQMEALVREAAGR